MFLLYFNLTTLADIFMKLFFQKLDTQKIIIFSQFTFNLHLSKTDSKIVHVTVYVNMKAITKQYGLYNTQ